VKNSHNSKQFFEVLDMDDNFVTPDEVEFDKPYKLMDMAFHGISCVHNHSLETRTIGTAKDQYWMSAKYQDVINKHKKHYCQQIVFEHCDG